MAYLEGSSGRGKRALFVAASQKVSTSINVCGETRAHVVKNQRPGESMDDTVRRLMGLEPRKRT